ncbi:MAG: FAD-dependent oxidoreductase [bacterium]
MNSPNSKPCVLVAGGGVAGVIAAVAAARAGASVVLAEAHSYLGGMANQALVQPYQTFHSPRGQVIRGIPQKYIEALVAAGGSLGHLLDPLGFAATVTPVDDEIARRVMKEMLAEEGVETRLSTAVAEIKIEAGKICGAKLSALDESQFPPGLPFGHWEKETLPEVSEEWFDVDAVVDATGSARIARMCGVPCELSDARQPMSWLFALAGVDLGAVSRHVWSHPEDFVLSDDPRAREQHYIGVSGFFSLVNEAKERGEWTLPRDRLLFFGTPREGEVMINTTRIPHDFGSDREIAMEGLRQIEFLLDFFRERVPGFGECFISRKADRLGVRESYRINGPYVLTRDDVVGGRKFPDTIALGAFPIDIHAARGGDLIAEKVGARGHYDIPLACLLTNEMDNLVMAGRHISVTHEAFASTRVMPTSMAVGQAAGTAAALIAAGTRPAAGIAQGEGLGSKVAAGSRAGATPGEIREYHAFYAALRELLIAEGAVVDDKQVGW